MQHERPATDVAYEHKDINRGQVIIAGLVIFFGMHLIAFLLWPYLDYLKSANPLPEPRPEISESFSQIRQPVLQPSPREDMQRLLDHQNSILNGGAPSTISIDRAIDMVVEQGLPPLGNAPGLNLWPPRAGSRLSGFDLELNRRNQAR